MAIARFPAVHTADKHGLLAVGGDLEVESLLLAYSQGIFPWPFPDEDIIPWFAPPERALLFLDEIHIGRSTKKALARTDFLFSIDRDFRGVLEHCQEYWSEHYGSTWLTERMIHAYIELHRAGFAHSVECYESGMLVGGLYGVSIGGMFAGESMFHLAPNASKFSLLYLADYLKQVGAKWIDCQVMNPFFEQLGARKVPREDFQRLLSDALSAPALFP